ncbi:MAG: hypothetical protein ACTSVP_09405 [Candidatus Heimdallarchaeota archaeon]
MKRKNVFVKADEFVKKVRERIPEASFHDCKNWAGRVANNYQYKNKPTVKLSQQEVIVNDVLLEMGLTATTAYKWLLLCDSPGDVQELLKQKRISIKDALKENKYRRKYQGSVYASKRRYHKMMESVFHLFIDDIIGNP